MKRIEYAQRERQALREPRIQVDEAFETYTVQLGSSSEATYFDQMLHMLTINQRNQQVTLGIQEAQNLQYLLNAMFGIQHPSRRTARAERLSHTAIRNHRQRR